ncbi:hypothetical protein B0T26DRAFT_631607 [Lasiosphaeria miniovina]|uniref:Uncharacterized protein n=1 Tax=Lasiosphaeria miniovina TaxID=1954250 RepID=A0AA40BIG8_9PEZI|nr:uncharacterized protein B0T26DRAFT_631607 [Lasiosphaeria miniovina]KAK0734815.1 hypothetical protein B0T26DRAFT_631607 [Lasiosphaeria miniovina]
MASFSGQLGGANKITKLRGKMVKPILKKAGSRSAKNSLDLGRAWEEQPADQLHQLDGPAWGNYGPRSQSVKDVSFVFSGALGVVRDGSAGTGAGAVHGRTASQASTGSGSRGFIHPFQQTPRTSTPPLSYANSLASFDNAKDYSPTITENEDDSLDPRSYSQQHHLHHASPSLPPTVSQSNLRRPSLASQRTSSLSDIASTAAPLRVNTNRSTATTSRLAHGSLTASHSDLHLNLAGSGLDSPTGSVGGTLPPPSLTSPPSSSAAAMLPIRSSLESAGFPRLRSRSELDTVARAENIRAARRKFEERERAKEEKYDREMIKKRERRDNKEASRIEKEAAARKTSFSGSEAARPSASRKTTPTNLSTSSAPVMGSGGMGGSLGKGNWKRAEPVMEEKQMAFVGRKYESVPPTQAPPAFGTGVDDVRFEQARPRRSSTAKKRTQSYWQGFILWLRTKLLRMSGR